MRRERAVRSRRQRAGGRGAGPSRHLPAARAPQRPRPDGHPVRLRDGVVRCLLRQARRRRRARVRHPDVVRPGGSGHHGRGTREGRPAAPRAAGGARRAGRPVRLLHLRRPGARRRTARRGAGPHSGHGGGGPRPQPVPVRGAGPAGQGRRTCRSQRLGRRGPAMTSRSVQPAGPAQTAAQPPAQGPPQTTAPTMGLPKHLDTNPILARWLRVRRDSVVEVRVGKVELGQGILTALGQVVADELSIHPRQVRMLPANTATGPDQDLTAGSMSVFGSGPALRVACANLRVLFTAAAARRWHVPPAEVTVADGVFSGPRRGMALGYGDLTDAVDLAVPADPAVTTRGPEEGRWVGTDAPRIDLPDKVAGLPRFIHDLRLPGQLFGRVVRPPSPGARLLDPGSPVVADADVEVVRDGSFLAVLGADEAEVARAGERLRAAARWSEGVDLPDEDALTSFLRAGPHETIPVLDEAGTALSGTTLRARYSRPFIAHASIAPSCGVARWEPDGSLSVWSHSQGVHRLRNAISAELGLDTAAVTVEHMQGAGCYGHNAADDAAFDAVLLARAVPGRPVQVQWSRRDELTWSPFGSAMTSEVEATVDASGKVLSWSYDVWGQGHTARPGYAGVPGLLAATHLAEPATYPAATDPPVRAGGGTVR